MFLVCFVLFVCFNATIGNCDTLVLVIVCRGWSQKNNGNSLGSHVGVVVGEGAILLRALGSGCEEKAWL